MSGRHLSSRKRRRCAVLETLEPRVVYHAGGASSWNYGGFEAHPTPIPEEILRYQQAYLLTSGDGGQAPMAAGVLHPLTDLPALSSLPNAAVSLYLDFNGNVDAQWGSESFVNTPVFDRDGDATTFSDAELTTIESVFTAVAEDYAPFNINVTTVPPASFANGASLRVAIGGDGSWLGGGYGGIAYVDSFTNSIVNTVYVFAKNLANGHAKFVADAVSHEAGHGFGLDHQASYGAAGNLLTEYSTGSGDGRGPIMGNSYASVRSLWWQGPNPEGATTQQDDMAIIARPANGFGYRPDDHGNTTATASAVDVAGTTISARGVITKIDDVDVFAFTTSGGDLTVNAAPIASFSNLDVKLELRDATSGLVLAASNPSTTLDASIATTLAAGTYHLHVASHGNYGDVGQYVVSGTVTGATSGGDGGSGGNGGGNTGGDTGGGDDTGGEGISPPPPADTFGAPSELSATPTSANRVDLTWQDNANTETSVRVERSTNGGRTWLRVAMLPADTTTYSATGLVANTAYQFRVLAVRGTEVTPTSNVVSTRTLPLPTKPAAPAQLRTSSVQAGAVTLGWTDRSNNEAGFRIERSLNRGRTWTVLGDVPAGTNSFVDSTTLARTQYAYRVRAFNAAGVSATSNTLIVTTPLAVSAGSVMATPRAAASLPVAASTISSLVCQVPSKGSNAVTPFVVSNPVATSAVTALTAFQRLSARTYAQSVDSVMTQTQNWT